MVNPSIWGEPGWVFLFSVVANYPNNPEIDIQHNYSRFFYHLRWVLPCESCMTNYEKHFRRWPIDQYLDSRARLFQWLVIIYNEVRLSLGKKPRDVPEILTSLFGPEEGQRMFNVFHETNVYCQPQQTGGGLAAEAGEEAAEAATADDSFNGLTTTLIISLILFVLWVYLTQK
jgi:hypothetical protein